MGKQELLIYVNGRFFPKSEAKIPVFDHGFLYGDGAFEGIRAYNGRVFKLKEHIDRLYESAKTIALEIPLTKEEMMEACAETFRINKLKEGYIRLVISRGPGRLGLDPRNCDAPTLVIIPSTYTITLTGSKSAKVITSSIRRTPQFCIPSSVKSLNYLNNILARTEAINASKDEAIMLDWRGFISEGAGDNIFIVKDQKLITPPLYSCILGGITRKTVIEIAERLSINVIEKDITPHDLYNADEAFLTGTGIEINSISEVDGRKLGTGKLGPVTKKIMDEFKKETKNPENGYPIFP